MKRRLKRAVKSALDVNRLYYRDAGGEKRPAFYNIDEIYPSLRELDRNYSVIREEVDSVLLQRDKLPRYHDLTERERYISGTVDADKDWKVFMLRCLVGTPTTNQKKCPRANALLAKIPTLYQEFFSILDPGKSIPAHCGPYLGYLRYHLALIVPRTSRPRCVSKTRFIPGRRAAASSSTIAGSTRSTTRVTVYGSCLSSISFVLCHLRCTRRTGFLTHLPWRYSEEGRQAMARIEKYSLKP
jgi:hypothetical protein